MGSLDRTSVSNSEQVPGESPPATDRRTGCPCLLNVEFLVGKSDGETSGNCLQFAQEENGEYILHMIVHQKRACYAQCINIFASHTDIAEWEVVSLLIVTFSRAIKLG